MNAKTLNEKHKSVVPLATQTQLITKLIKQNKQTLRAHHSGQLAHNKQKDVPLKRNIHFAAPEAVYELNAEKGSQAPEQKNAPMLRAPLLLGGTEAHEQLSKSHNVYAEKGGQPPEQKNAPMLTAQLALGGTEDRKQCSKSHHVYAAKKEASHQSRRIHLSWERYRPFRARGAQKTGTIVRNRTMAMPQTCRKHDGSL
jgi:hypothetical protein